MKFLKSLSDDYFKLFVKREGKVVLGKGWSTLWLLTGVLTATFLAIAFSNASIKYLSDKMNDPFIRWVDIQNNYGEGDFSGLAIALGQPENMAEYDYSGYQSDYRFSYMFIGPDENHLQYYRCRFFEDIHSDLVEAVLSEDNVVDGCCISDFDHVVPNKTVGIVITKSALTKLGYDKAPAFIDMLAYCKGAEEYGFDLYQNEFARAPIPVLAVVKRLPSNVDIISSTYFFEQEMNNDTYPFNLANYNYATSLIYYVPQDVDYSAFLSDLNSFASNLTSNFNIDEHTFYKEELMSWIPGSYISLVGDQDAIDPMELKEVNDAILEKWGAKNVCRVYDYDFSPYADKITDKSYLSVSFNSLHRIRDFETFVQNNYKVKIDMSQINSKEIFNSVSVMANVLSWAIIVFAIVCIVLFIVNLLQSYFQKVKRNLGTFKAFGVSNSSLIRVYALIMFATIAASILLALAITFSIQELLIIFHVLKDGAYSYLSLWSVKTLLSILIILTVSVYTVYHVMRKLLKQTPGDLIYDRQ